MTGKELLDFLSSLDHNELGYTVLFFNGDHYLRVDDAETDFNLKTIDLFRSKS